MSEVFATGTSSESPKATEAAIKRALSLPKLTALTRKGNTLFQGVDHAERPAEREPAKRVVLVTYPTSFKTALHLQIEIWKSASGSDYQLTFLGKSGPLASGLGHSQHLEQLRADVARAV